MKPLILLLGLISTVVFAAEPHWIRIGDGVYVRGSDGVDILTQVYLDDANVIDEDGYNGFTVRWTLPVPVNVHSTLGVALTYQSVETIVEYSCHANVGRGKRTNILTLSGKQVAVVHESWQSMSLDGSVVIDLGASGALILNAVKNRVCFHT